MGSDFSNYLRFKTQATWLRIDNDTSPVLERSFFPSASKVKKTILPTVALTLTEGCTRPPFSHLNYLHKVAQKTGRETLVPETHLVQALSKFEGWQAKKKLTRARR